MGSPGRAGGRRIGALALALLLAAAASAVVSSPASAAGISNLDGKPPKVSRVSGSAVVASPIQASPAAVERYWTPERMMNAKPADQPSPEGALDIPDLGGYDASSSAATGDFTPANVTAYPQRIQGKVFFRVGSDNFTCSGTVVESAGRNLVFTAGHCVYDQVSGFVDEIAFVPGYENGPTLYDTYSGLQWFTTPRWASSGSNSYDIGLIALQQPIEDLGARKIAFDLNPVVNRKKREYTIYGYPSKPSDRFDGETLQGCRAAFAFYDSTPPNIAPLPMAAKPCFMQQGASGGGWITLGNYLASVVSYGYCDNLPRDCGRIYGPVFSNAAKALYVGAGGSVAPTVKVLAGPPKVVRKRKVKFRFGGTASTLLGYTCQLDRQKKVSCSSKISISRLTAGRHTLRVRAIDQTGRVSRQIVRNFRVVLPRR